MSIAISRRAPRVKLLCALVASCFAAEGLANPTGPAVVSGNASFATVGKTLTVTNSPNAIINWQGFSIGAGEATRFQQQSASSAVLNRVVGQDPSAILGTLWSNGRVFLVNPNGILFGQGSRVDVAGLVASTLNISDGDFLGGRLKFQAGAVANSIVNHGELHSATGGHIYLVSPDITNSGLISSPNGDVVLAAGKSVSLVDIATPNLKVEVAAEAGQARNLGQIVADSGRVGVYAGLINQQGIVRADSVTQDAAGRIVFKASDTTLLESGSVTSATGPKGGEVRVLGNKVGLVGNAVVDVSGHSGGGRALIGGDYQGKNPEIQNAEVTYFGPQSSVRADAISIGDGGKVIVWADDTTRAYGSISARGGAQGGNGGFAEVSGKRYLDYRGMADLSAPAGRQGELLLDPNSINITNGSDSFGGGSFSGGDPNFFSSGSDGSSEITWATIKSNLATASVNITTSGDTLGPADITVSANSPDLTTSRTLRLVAEGDVNVNGSITNTGTGSIEMYSGWDGNNPGGTTFSFANSGQIFITAPITIVGDVLLRANSGISDLESSLGVITANGLLASAVNGSVSLENAVHAVGVLAGTATSQFLFRNGSALQIGTVGGVSGIGVAAPAGSGLSANISIQAAGISATAGNNLSAFGAASASLSGGLGQITLISTGDVTLNGISATAGGGNSTDSIGGGNGGDGLLLIRAGGTIDLTASTVMATGGTSLTGSPGVGSLQLEVSTASGNAAAAGDIKIHNLIADDVNVQQLSKGVAKSILRTSGTSLITANQLLLEIDDPIDTGGGSIGTSAAPMRARLRDTTLSALKLEAHTHENSPGIFVEVNPDGVANAGKLQIGDVSFFSGGVKGVQTLGGGDISIATNITGVITNTLTVASGSAGCGSGGGTGGPVCTTSGNVTLRADNMTIGNTVSGTGAVTLEPYTQSRNVAIFDPLALAPVALALTPAEIDFVNVGTGTLQIGRTDGTGNLTVTTPLVTADVNAGRLHLLGGNVTVSSSIGSLGTPFDRYLELRANSNLTLLSGSVYVSDGRNLVLQANNDLSAGGDLLIGGGGVQVDVRAGTTATNTANMFLGGSNITIAGSTGGFGTNVQLAGLGNQIVTASGDVLIQGSSSPNGGVFVQALSGSQQITAGGGFRVASGTGNNSSAYVSAGTGQTVQAQYVEVVGQNSSNFTFLQNGTSGLQFINTTGQNLSGEGLLINSGQVENSGGAQTIHVNNANRVRVIAQSALAGLQATGTQTILVQGASSLNSLEVSSSGSAFPSQISGANQSITVGNSGQAGAIVITGGSGENQLSGIRTTAGTQSIATTGTITVTGGTSGGPSGAQTGISSQFGLQTISANGIVLQGTGTGTNNDAGIESSAGQTISVGAGGILLQAGTGTGNRVGIEQGSGAATQQITVTNGGTIELRGGASGTNNGALIGTAGNQTISATGITLNGGTGGGGSGVGNGALIGSNSSQSITVGSGGLTLAAGGNALSAGTTDNAAIISQQGLGGTQTITVNGGGSIVLTGGHSPLTAVGTTHGSRALLEARGTSQTINFTAGGSMTLTGGTTGSRNYAQIFVESGSQTIVGAPALTMDGGTSGGIDGEGNLARIYAFGGQTLTFSSVLMRGGSGGTENFAQILKDGTTGTQTVTATSGGITLRGGTGGGGFDTGNFAQIRSNGSQVLNVTGGMLLQGGSGTLTDNFASVFQSLASGTQTINMNGGGTLDLRGGSSQQSGIGTASGHGSFAFITSDGTAQNIDFPAGGAIDIRGGTVGSRNNAGILARNGSQSIMGSPNIQLIGGASGGVADEGNFASILADVGSQFIEAGNLTLQAGAAGINNFAVIQAPVQDIFVSGNLSLTGGGSAAGGSSGGGARIGGRGGATPGPTDLVLIVDGNLTMTGGSVANAGTTIGNGIAGGQATDIEIDVAGNVTLNPGTVANAGSRIGSPASSIAGGDILITAGGTIALNSNLGLGTAIRTLGNVTLDAASITQGADSVIQAGTLTTVTSGSQTWNGTNTVTSLSATTGGGSLDFTNATTLTVLAAATSGGAVEITVNSGDLNIPGQVNAGTGGVTLVAPTGTVNGTGTSPDIVGGTLDITAGTITGAGGLHTSVPQINSLVATAGEIDVSSFTTATLQNAQASGAITLNSTAPLSITGPVVSGTNQVSISSPATSFAGNVSLTNYSFGSSTTLQSGTLNLAGTTTIPLGTTVSVQGGTLNASSGTVNVAGTMQTTSGSVSASTVNLTGLFDASGGSVTVGTLNVQSGGTLKGTGTITGNVNNSAGTVSPGASPGTLTITGNYVQGPSGILDMQIGGLVAGSDYDRLVVSGTATLGGTLNTSLINGFVPATGNSFTFVQAAGGISGSFTTISMPAGTFFNSLYGLTTFEVVAAAATSITSSINTTVDSTTTAPLETLTELLTDPETNLAPESEIIIAPIVETTTTTAEGTVAVKPPACN